MTAAARLPVRWRVPILLTAGLALLGGLLTTGPGWVGKAAMMLASVALLGIYHALWTRQQSVALLAQAVGAFGWYAATLLWLSGFPIGDTVPWMVVFVAATIAGERLELAHVTLLPAHAERWFLTAVAALPVTATAAAVWPRAGTHLFGFALLALTAWLAVFDVARRTVRGSGLPRYAAVGLLSGYGWLAVAGLLWAGAGPAGDGARYDAALHAVFLGFTLSMIFVHAPVVALSVTAGRRARVPASVALASS